MGWGVKQMLMSLSQLAHMSSRGRGRERRRERDWHLSVSGEIDGTAERCFARLLFRSPYKPPKLKCQEINYSLWEISLPVEHFESYQLRKHEKKKRV